MKRILCAAKRTISCFFLVAFCLNTRAQFTILGTVGTQPIGMAIDPSGNLYVTNESSNNVSKISSTGVVTANWAPTGQFPMGITIDPYGNLYVVNGSSNTISKITPAGVSTINWASTGLSPREIAIDASGNLYVTNNAEASITKITPAGVSTINWASTASSPYAIAIDASGNIYATSYDSNVITKISPSGTSILNWANTGTYPLQMAIDASGNIYTSNYLSNNVSKITPAGLSTVNWASTGLNPYGITISPNGNIFVANTGSNSITQITPAGDSATILYAGTTIYPIVLSNSGYIYTAGPLSNDVYKSGSPIILPITISSFIGTHNNGQNILDWSIADAENFSRFQLQREEDVHESFTSIATITYQNGVGNYSFVDMNPDISEYYRLALIDIDGNTKYSNIVFLASGVKGIVVNSIFPVPASTTLTVALNAANPTSLIYSITDLLGKEVKNEIHTANGPTIQTMDISNLSKAVYILNIKQGNTIICTKLFTKD